MLKAILTTLCLSACAIAQNSQPAAKTLVKHEQAIEAWLAPSMFNGTIHGATATDTRLVEAGLRYRRDLFTRKNITMRYTADVIPMAMFRDPYVVGSPRWVYGGGFSPLGLQFVFRSDKKVRPFFGGSAGFLFHTQPLMLSGVHYSFTADWNVGAEFKVQPKHTLSVAFRYHHLSDAETGAFNFGAEHGMVRIGYTLWQSK